MERPKIQVLRSLESERAFSARRFFLQWEWMLLIVFILVNVLNAFISPNYLHFGNIMSALQDFSDKAVLVFPMMLIILMGDIDISVASTMALSAVIMAMAYAAGLNMILAMVLALVVGGICGFINGVIIAKFKELPSMIVTLSTMIIYRGIATILLEDGAIGSFPSWYSYFGWGQVGPFPFIFLFFIVEAIIFAYFVHKTKYGRRVYAIGSNPVTSQYSGVQVDKIKIINYTIIGIFAAIAAIFLTSKMGSARPNIAKGYELDIIAMVVLGGVSTSGGHGNVLGVILATLTIGLLRYGLGLANIPSQTIVIIVGALLIIAVAIPNLKEYFSSFRVFSKKAKVN